MNKHNLKDMVRGWCVGDFEPSIIKTKDFEVAVQRWNKNDKPDAHVHKIAKEINVIISGTVKFNNVEFNENDIVVIDAGEPATFESITDSIIVVIKQPSVQGDKYKI